MNSSKTKLMKVKSVLDFLLDDDVKYDEEDEEIEAFESTDSNDTNDSILKSNIQTKTTNSGSLKSIKIVNDYNINSSQILSQNKTIHHKKNELMSGSFEDNKEGLNLN